MRHGDYFDTDRNFSIDDVERKLVENVTARTRLEVGPDRWRAGDESDRTIHFSNKSLGRLVALSEVPFEGFVDLIRYFHARSV